MPRGNISKLLWVDSSVNTHGDRTRVHFPPEKLTAGGPTDTTFSISSAV